MSYQLAISTGMSHLKPKRRAQIENFAPYVAEFPWFNIDVLHKLYLNIFQGRKLEHSQDQIKAFSLSDDKEINYEVRAITCADFLQSPQIIRIDYNVFKIEAETRAVYLEKIKAYPTIRKQIGLFLCAYAAEVRDHILSPRYREVYKVKGTMIIDPSRAASNIVKHVSSHIYRNQYATKKGKMIAYYLDFLDKEGVRDAFGGFIDYLKGMQHYERGEIEEAVKIFEKVKGARNDDGQSITVPLPVSIQQEIIKKLGKEKQKFSFRAKKQKLIIISFSQKNKEEIIDSDFKIFFENLLREYKQIFREEGIYLELLTPSSKSILNKQINDLLKEHYEYYFHFYAQNELFTTPYRDWIVNNEGINSLLDSPKIKFCFFPFCNIETLEEIAQDNNIPIILGFDKVRNIDAWDIQRIFYNELAAKRDLFDAIKRTTARVNIIGDRSYKVEEYLQEPSGSLKLLAKENKFELSILYREGVKNNLPYLIYPNALDLIPNLDKNKQILLIYYSNLIPLERFKQSFEQNGYSKNYSLLELKERDLNALTNRSQLVTVPLFARKVKLLIVFNNQIEIAAIESFKRAFNEQVLSDKNLEFAIAFNEEKFDSENNYLGQLNFEAIVANLETQNELYYNQGIESILSDQRFDSFLKRIDIDLNLRKELIFNAPISPWQKEFSNISYTTPIRVFLLSEDIDSRLVNYLINWLIWFMEIKTPVFLNTWNDSSNEKSALEAIKKQLNYSYGRGQRNKPYLNIIQEILENEFISVLNLNKNISIEDEAKEIKKIFEAFDAANILESIGETTSYIFITAKHKHDLNSFEEENYKIIDFKKLTNPSPLSKKVINSWFDDYSLKNEWFEELVREENLKEYPDNWGDFLAFLCNGLKIPQKQILGGYVSQLSNTENDLEKQQGYNSLFLGANFEVTLPIISPLLENEIAVVKDSKDNILHYPHHSIIVNAKREFAFYSAANVNDKLWKNDLRGNKWVHEKRLNQSLVGNNLYQGNSFDRGHLTRRSVVNWGVNQEERDKAINSVNNYANAVPQHKLINQKSWLDLELAVLGFLQQLLTKGIIMTGSALLEDDPIYREIQIPLYFWKVLYYVNKKEELCRVGFLVGQGDLLLNEGIIKPKRFDRTFLPDNFKDNQVYQVSISLIEDLTTLTFVEALDYSNHDYFENRGIISLTNLFKQEEAIAAAEEERDKEDDYLPCRAYQGHLINDKVNNVAFFKIEDGRYYFVTYKENGSIGIRSEGFKTAKERDQKLSVVLRLKDRKDSYKRLEKGKYYMDILYDETGREVGRSCLSNKEEEAAAILAAKKTEEEAIVKKAAAAATLSAKQKKAAKLDEKERRQYIKMLREGNVSEAMENLSNRLENQSNSSSYKEVIRLKDKMKGVNTRRLNQTISHDDFNVEKNIITKSMLNLISQLSAG